MTDTYAVRYSQEALDDLRGIYAYIAYELLAKETAAKQVKRIRDEIRALDFMPYRYARVEWEPWHAMDMRQLPIGNFIAYYLVDTEDAKVTVVRIFYGGRDIQEIVQS